MTTEASRDLALGVRHRSFELGRGLVDAQGRAEFACSSEEPVLSHDWSIGRYLEILDHSPGAIRMDRLRSGAPLLKDHNREVQIGVIEDAAIANRRLRVRARFGNSEAAKAERADVADGIRSKCSVGYLIHELRLEEKRADGIDVYRAVSWEPLEVSTVAIPADPTVGFGRAAQAEFQGHLTKVRGDSSMTTGATPITTHPNGAPHTAVRELATDERDRCAEIMAIAKRFNCVDDGLAAIQAGTPWQQFRDRVWASQPEPVLLDRGRGHLGMRPTAPFLSARESAEYSPLGQLFRIAEGRGREPSLEIELSDELARQSGQGLRGEHSFLVHPRWFDGMVKQRDLEVGGSASGAPLRGTELLASSFIAALRDQTRVMQLGATVLNGLVGNVDIPRQLTGAAAQWIAEGANAPESQLTLDKVSMAPSTIAVSTDMTRRVVKQSTPSIEALVRADLIAALGLGIDSAAINGSGSGATPRGIRNVVGVPAITWVTTTGVTKRKSALDMVASVANANAENSSAAFLTTSAARAALQGTYSDTAGAGLPLWAEGRDADGFSSFLGYRAAISNGLPKTLGAGTNEHAILFGSWSDLLIGFWGVLDLNIDPYALGASGGLTIRAFHDVSIAVRYPQSFAISSFIP